MELTITTVRDYVSGGITAFYNEYPMLVTQISSFDDAAEKLLELLQWHLGEDIEAVVTEIFRYYYNEGEYWRG